MTLTRQLPRDVEGRHLPALRRELLASLRRDPDLDLDCSDVEVLCRPRRHCCCSSSAQPDTAAAGSTWTGPRAP